MSTNITLLSDKKLFLKHSRKECNSEEMREGRVRNDGQLLCDPPPQFLTKSQNMEYTF